jgi:hypothetical protein
MQPKSIFGMKESVENSLNLRLLRIGTSALKFSRLPKRLVVSEIMITVEPQVEEP